MDVRRLDSRDAALALAVATRAIRETEGTTYSTTQVAAWLAGMDEERFRVLLGESATLGAFEDDELVGFATFVEANGSLEFLYVDPASWRRGVARRLVADIEHHARSVGAREIRVDASLLARPMLERLGYTVVSEYKKAANGAVFDNAWLSKSL